jgi:hypothetical protein
MKRLLASGVGAQLLRTASAARRSQGRLGSLLGLASSTWDVERSMDVERATRRGLLYFVLPIWMGAGLLDWWWHRKTKIQETSGTHESMIHTLMMTEAGIPVMMGLFLEVNALVLLTAIVAVLVHEATAFWDVAYAEERREVTPNEQHTHSFLEVVPFMATAFLIALHPDQFRTLVGVGDAQLRFELRPKSEPLPRGYVSGILAAFVATVMLPYAEEIWRCYQVDRTLDAHPPTRHVTYDEDGNTAPPDEQASSDGGVGAASEETSAEDR